MVFDCIYYLWEIGSWHCLDSYWSDNTHVVTPIKLLVKHHICQKTVCPSLKWIGSDQLRVKYRSPTTFIIRLRGCCVPRGFWFPPNAGQKHLCKTTNNLDFPLCCNSMSLQVHFSTFLSSQCCAHALVRFRHKNTWFWSKISHKNNCRRLDFVTTYRTRKCPKVKWFHIYECWNRFECIFCFAEMLTTTILSWWLGWWCIKNSCEVSGFTTDLLLGMSMCQLFDKKNTLTSSLGHFARPFERVPNLTSLVSPSLTRTQFQASNLRLLHEAKVTPVDQQSCLILHCNTYGEASGGDKIMFGFTRDKLWQNSTKVPQIILHISQS